MSFLTQPSRIREETLNLALQHPQHTQKYTLLGMYQIQVSVGIRIILDLQSRCPFWILQLQQGNRDIFQFIVKIE